MYTNLIAAALVGIAHVVSSGTGSAPDIVSELQAQGYQVQFNGQPSGGLSQCTVTGVHEAAPVAYVDLDCPAGT
ncbi:hypothetical protein Y900_016845 [Mycolicibacterium aromaticivorans JS19b1 = JCM 16368]|uniref:Uncharacterized protein n=1 Tax=Mycolicibacterium aromaticivorans JS19b1 = JCM 16368 TaxID=1440774 RepID=A0A064CIZ4_9MYCO|nr:hypothetical protein [Mycolicibacterium aromaticivorans]KDF00565.1 hypothetical protein Y900_016845 [Mycolicibacterium aromaticivorans JS19b1 = JCM 16368]